MDPKLREYLLILCEGDINHAVLPILHFISNFTRRDDIFSWLVKNKISGNDILFMIQFHFDRSRLDFVKWVISNINKERELKPIFYGKDYR